MTRAPFTTPWNVVISQFGKEYTLTALHSDDDHETLVFDQESARRVAATLRDVYDDPWEAKEGE